MNFKFTTREIENALDKMVILIDSREKNSKKCKDEWDRNNVKYYSIEEFKKYNKELKIPKKDLYEAKLPAGDYSAMLPKGCITGIDRALWFDKITIVEKKASINELAGNIRVTNGEYQRMCNEFARLKSNGTRYRIFIEDYLFFKHLYEGTGNQRHGWKNQDSLAGAIDRCLSDWGTELIPIPEEYMAIRILSTLKNDVRTYLKENFEIKNIDKIIDNNL